MSVSIQAQAGGGLALFRGDLGVDLYDSGGRRGGFVSLGAWSFVDEPPELGFGGVGAIGASGTDAGTGLFLAAAPFLFVAPEESDPCNEAFVMGSIALGFRLRGDALELFLAPHLHRVFEGCGPSS